MPRRAVITIAEIYKRRSFAWEWHYKCRQVAQLVAHMDTEKIARIISRHLPAPIIRMDGTLTEGIATLRGVEAALNELHFSIERRDLICIWYWSQAGWDNFVEQFQSLPEPTENCYLAYNSEEDSIMIVPMSMREPNANKGTKKVHVGGSALVVPFSKVER